MKDKQTILKINVTHLRLNQLSLCFWIITNYSDFAIMYNTNWKSIDENFGKKYEDYSNTFAVLISDELKVFMKGERRYAV